MSAKTHCGRFSFANLSQLHVVEAHTNVFFTLELGSLALPTPHEDQYFIPSFLLLVAVGRFVLWCAKHKLSRALLGSAVPRRVGDLGLVSLVLHLGAIC